MAEARNVVFQPHEHLPTTVPSPWGVHCCAPVPLQVHSWILVPSAVPAPETSRHLPSARKVLSSPMVQRWAALELHVQICTLVPSAVPALSTSRHLPFTPFTSPVRGPDGLPACLIRMLRKATSSPSPWFCRPMCPCRRLRAGSVFVKSLIFRPFRNSSSRSPVTRISYVFQLPGGLSAASRAARSADLNPYTAPVVRSALSVASIWIS